MKLKLKNGYYRFGTVSKFVMKIKVRKNFINKFSIQISTINDDLSSVKWANDIEMNCILNSRKVILNIIAISADVD